MNFKDAVTYCHVRSAIYRTTKPEVKYWNNHPVPLEQRVPKEDQEYSDWQEYDPRDDDNGSLFMYND